MTCLSIITADAVTPDPTYLTSARSSRPWIVPSSPNGPCSSGKTTSTSPSVRGGAPASCTARVRSVALVGTMTLAAAPSISGTWPGASRSASGSSGTRTQWPSLAMPTGTTSYRSRSSASRTLAAVAQETACSEDRPPKTRATRVRRGSPSSSRRGAAGVWSLVIARDSIR